MPSQFKSMDELVAYLGALELRLEELSSDNSKLRGQLVQVSQAHNAVVTKYDARSIPRTNLFSQNFLVRAFAVWGHFFVANLIISLILGACYFALFVVLFGSTIQR